MGIALLAGGMLLWAGYNYLRFHNKHRRAHVNPMSPKEIAQYLGIDGAVLRRTRANRVVAVRHDATGAPLAFIPLDVSVGECDVRSEEDVRE
ncbi:MAG: poly-beta-1,6-N-acetyl-D-glucosamine biosynthesis protein PgaD [Halothiobacillaceae bacterium]